MKKAFSHMLLFATLLSFTACGDDEPDGARLSKTSYTMYHDATRDIEGDNLSDIVWDSENEFVATIEDNIITGQLVGKTTIKSTEHNLTFSVEVEPQYHTYEEPDLDWGASKSTIKAKYGTPVSEKTDNLIYQTSNTNAPLVIYIFKNGKMSTCGVLCNVSVAEELTDFLLERYVPIDVDADNYSVTLTHCYGKISDPQIDYALNMQYSSSIGGILVAYTHIDMSKSRGADNIDFDGAFHALENALQ